MFAKSLTKLANGVAGKQRKAVGNDVIKKNRPVRGQIKVRIFKMIMKSIKNLGNGVFVGKKKAAGRSCLTPPATVIPIENVGEMELDGGEKGKINIEIEILKTIGAVGGGRIPLARVLTVGL